MTSSTSSGFTLARSRAPLIATLPRSCAGTAPNAPLNEPIGVRCARDDDVGCHSALLECRPGAIYRRTRERARTHGRAFGSTRPHGPGRSRPGPAARTAGARTTTGERRVAVEDRRAQERRNDSQDESRDRRHTELEQPIDRDYRHRLVQHVVWVDGLVASTRKTGRRVRWRLAKPMMANSQAMVLTADTSA